MLSRAVTLAVALVAVACAPPSSEPGADATPAASTGVTNEGLLGTGWRLAEVGGAPALSEVEATLEFGEDGRVAGSGSCNRFSGPVEIAGSAISFGTLAATRMACADAVMRQETRYFAALDGAERFTVDGDTLLISGGDTDTPLRFVRTRSTEVGSDG